MIVKMARSLFGGLGWWRRDCVRSVVAESRGASEDWRLCFA